MRCPWAAVINVGGHHKWHFFSFFLSFSLSSSLLILTEGIVVGFCNFAWARQAYADGERGPPSTQAEIFHLWRRKAYAKWLWQNRKLPSLHCMCCGHSSPHWHVRKFSAPLCATQPGGKFIEIVNEQKMLQMDIKTKRQKTEGWGGEWKTKGRTYLQRVGWTNREQELIGVCMERMWIRLTHPSWNLGWGFQKWHY